MFGNNADLIEKFLGKDSQLISESEYKSGKGRLLLEGDEFKFFNSSPAGEIIDFSEENVEKLCRKEMERLGILSELYAFSGINFVDDGIRGIFTAQNEKTTFFDAYISFDITDKGISAVSGRNLISALEVSHSGADFLNIISILPDLSENSALEKGVAHTVVSITPGYYIGRTAESYKNILAIPVWQIATDSGKILYYDARNGNSIEE